MNSSFTLPGGTVLYLEEASRGLRLYPALDGARLELTVKVWASQAVPQLSMQMSANLQASRRPHHDARRIGPVRPTGLVTVNPSPTQVVFTGHVSAQGLREIEEMRHSNALWLTLTDLRLTGAVSEPAGLAEFTGTDMPIEVLSEEWTTQLEKVTATSYVEILVPVTDDPEMATAAGRLRTARQYIRDGIYNAVASELRQALDAVRGAYDTKNVADTTRPKKARERSVPERWALTVEDTYSLLSAFIHDDEEAIAGAVLDRALAVNLLGDVAGKVHRLAADRGPNQI